MQYPKTEESPYPGVASHIPVLWTIREFQSVDAVYEFGAGIYSTNLFGVWTKTDQTVYITGENSREWSPGTRHERHSVFEIDSAMKLMLGGTHNSLAFVDCEANLRAGLVNHILDETDVGCIVVHDTELMADRAYRVRRTLLRWPSAVTVRCPFTAIETTVATRNRMHNLDMFMSSMKTLSNNSALHRLRWELAQIFVQSHR